MTQFLGVRRELLREVLREHKVDEALINALVYPDLPEASTISKVHEGIDYSWIYKGDL